MKCSQSLNSTTMVQKHLLIICEEMRQTSVSQLILFIKTDRRLGPMGYSLSPCSRGIMQILLIVHAVSLNETYNPKPLLNIYCHVCLFVHK